MPEVGAPTKSLQVRYLGKTCLLGRSMLYFARFENWGEEDFVEGRDFPNCLSCPKGVLLPLSDFGSQGAPIHYKAWVCNNPDCGFNIKIRNGDVYLNEPIANGASYTPRFR